MNQVLKHAMCGAEPGLISVDQALSYIQQQSPRLKTERIPLKAALNRYLAQDLYSHIHLPLFAQSAVDGYAICAEADQLIAENTDFEVVGECRAGEVSSISLLPRQAIRIFTGAAIPENTTTVARQEIVQLQHTPHRIQLTQTLKLHADIRDMGEELAKGERLAHTGQHLNVGAIAALSMAGVDTVSVYTQPKIAVVITGDEVAQTVEDFESGKIFDANGPLIQTWFQQQHLHADIMYVSDGEQAVFELFDRLKDQYDLVITTGGVSVGDYDFVRPVALALGFEQIFWKVKQKPGKPMLFAKYTRQDHSQCLLLGLPGNPAAVYVGMYIYISTLLYSLQGQLQPLPWFSAVSTTALKKDARDRFLRMSAYFEHGVLKLSNLSKQQSHMLSNLMQANCLVRIPADQTIEAGQILHGILIQP